MELIQQRRLLEARRLLTYSSMSVAEIAYRLQFQDPSYFGRFFRDHTGQPPGAFRNTAGNSLNSPVLQAETAAE